MRLNLTKPLFSAIPLILAVILLLFGPSAFAQCSTSAWSSTGGTAPTALGLSTSPVGKRYEQNCGLTVDATEAPSYVTTTTPTGETSFTSRFYFLASALSITSGDVTLFTARNGSTVELELRLRSTGSVNHLVAYYQNDGSLDQHPNPIPLEDIWNAVEVSWSRGSGDGTFELKLDNVQKYTKTDLTNGSAVINEIDFGIVNSATATGELVLDAFDLRRTSAVGLLATNEMWGISTRAEVRTEYYIAIGGFIITGDTDKCVIVRGRGPSVQVTGVTLLPDPTIELYSGATPIFNNDNWQDWPESQAIIDQGLAPGNSLDAAMYVCLPPGPYTVLLRGKGTDTGIGIVEIFDADVGTPFLFGISTRSTVDTGESVAIGGFIIQGDEPKQVLIRGRGPSVDIEAQYRLADPYITLYDGTGTPFRTNDDWEQEANSDDILSSGLAPGDVKDSAILLTLDPGLYTAILSIASGAAGVGIVEVFDQTGGSIAAQ